MKNNSKSRIICPTKFSSFVENSDALTRLLYLVKTSAEANLGKGTKLSEYLSEISTIQNKQRDEIRNKTLSEIKEIADILSNSNNIKAVENKLRERLDDKKKDPNSQSDDEHDDEQHSEDSFNEDSPIETVKLSSEMKDDPNVAALFEKDQNQ